MTTKEEEEREVFHSRTHYSHSTFKVGTPGYLKQAGRCIDAVRNQYGLAHEDNSYSILGRRTDTKALLSLI